MIAYEYIPTRFEGYWHRRRRACVYIRSCVLWMDRSTPMNVESGLSPYCWALNTVEVMACIPGRTRQPQGLPGSLLNSRESPHEFPCQTLEREEVTREHESLLTSLACCKILSPRVVHLIFFFFFFENVNSNRLSLSSSGKYQSLSSFEIFIRYKLVRKHMYEIFIYKLTLH